MTQKVLKNPRSTMFNNQTVHATFTRLRREGFSSHRLNAQVLLVGFVLLGGLLTSNKCIVYGKLPTNGMLSHIAISPGAFS